MWLEAIDGWNSLGPRREFDAENSHIARLHPALHRRAWNTHLTELQHAQSASADYRTDFAESTRKKIE